MKILMFGRGVIASIYGWALDLPNTLILDWSYTPTNFDAWVCGQGKNGGGQALKDYFLSSPTQ